MRTHYTLLALCLSVASTRGQEMVDNVEFTAWSKHKKGSAITLKMTSSSVGTKSEITSTFTLVEVGADKLVLETVSVTTANGKELKLPPMKREVPKQVPLPKGKKELQTKPEGVYDEGNETVKAAGTEYKTKWMKFRFEKDGIKTEGQTWTCDEVPGTLVKMTTKSTGKFEYEMIYELTEVKRP